MTFTKVGRPHTEGKERQFAAICAAMEWQKVPESGPGVMLGAMAAMAITSVVRHYHLVGVTHLAVSHALAPYGLYGIRCPDREYFVVDEGDSCVVAGYTELEKQGEIDVTA